MKAIRNNLNLLNTNIPELWVVFAHPDDEAIFFFQAIQWLNPKRLHLICVETQLGYETEVRINEFYQSAKKLGAEFTLLGLIANESKHIAVDTLKEELKKLGHVPNIPVLTHGVMGEYGHAGHVDVFLAASEIFGEDLWVLSGPLEPHLILVPNAAELDRQKKFISSIYLSQEPVWEWAPRVINLTHFNLDKYGPAIKRMEPPADFLKMLKNKYRRAIEDWPHEAKRVAEFWDSELLKSRVRERIADWEVALNG